jgi:hypothetical protein
MTQQVTELIFQVESTRIFQPQILVIDVDGDRHRVCLEIADGLASIWRGTEPFQFCYDQTLDFANQIPCILIDLPIVVGPKRRAKFASNVGLDDWLDAFDNE